MLDDQQSLAQDKVSRGCLEFKFDFNFECQEIKPDIMIDLTGSLKLTSKLVLKSLLEISKVCELPEKFSSA